MHFVFIQCRVVRSNNAKQWSPQSALIYYTCVELPAGCGYKTQPQCHSPWYVVVIQAQTSIAEQQSWLLTAHILNPKPRLSRCTVDVAGTFRSDLDGISLK